MNNLKIVLIGGAPMVGKTTVGLKIAMELGFGYLCSEDLADGIIAVTNRNTHESLHILEQVDHREYFMSHSAARMVSDAQTRNKACWPAVERVIMNHMNYLGPIVIEGWDILPHQVRKLQVEGVAALWLTAGKDVFEQRVMQQEDYFVNTTGMEMFMQRFIERSVSYDELIRQHLDELELPRVDVKPDMSEQEIIERCMEAIGQGCKNGRG
ncbi:MAG: hypothetical protein K9M57_05985 [Phycisphaerae bacterium]|nr:hypothetical protein [Phycisphaerae bacterium]